MRIVPLEVGQHWVNIAPVEGETYWARRAVLQKHPHLDIWDCRDIPLLGE